MWVTAKLRLPSLFTKVGMKRMTLSPCMYFSCLLPINIFNGSYYSTSTPSPKKTSASANKDTEEADLWLAFKEIDAETATAKKK